LNIQFWYYETTLGGFHGLYTFNIPSGRYPHPDVWYLFGFPLDKEYKLDHADAKIYLETREGQWLMTDSRSGVATKAMVKGEIVEVVEHRWELRKQT
jgi:hypothetical protein